MMGEVRPVHYTLPDGFRVEYVTTWHTLILGRRMLRCVGHNPDGTPGRRDIRDRKRP